MASKTITYKSDYKPFQWQSDVHRGLSEHWYGAIHVVKSKRQCGKSIMIENILLKSSLSHSHQCSFCVSPTIAQAQKIFSEIKNAIISTPLYKRHNDVKLMIEFVNGSTIYLKSAEQREALRGFTVSKCGVLCIDEAAYISDDVFYSILAWTNVHRAPIVMTSTPRVRQGFFYKYYELGLSSSNNNIYSYNWSDYDTSALLSNEVLEQYRLQLPVSQFKTEFLGEFLDNDSSVFGNYQGVLRDVEYNPMFNTYIGIDWGSGKGQDYTAISVADSNMNQVYIDYFNNRDETETIEYIIGIIKRFNPLKVVVETNSIGNIFFGLLDRRIKEEGLVVQLIGFVTTNESKQRLVNTLQVNIQNSRITLLPDPELQVELSMYEGKISGSGKWVFNAANGYHDDLIIATMLSFEGISAGVYNIR